MGAAAPRGAGGPACRRPAATAQPGSWTHRGFAVQLPADWDMSTSITGERSGMNLRGQFTRAPAVSFTQMR